MSAYPVPTILPIFNSSSFPLNSDFLTIQDGNKFLEKVGGTMSGGLTTNAGINNTAGNIVLNSTALRFKDNLNNNNAIVYIGGGTNGLVAQGENRLFLSTSNVGGTIINNRITNFNEPIKIGINGNNINNLQTGRVSNSGSSTYTITFPNPYGSTPNVIANLVRNNIGFSFVIQIQSITATDFTYTVYAQSTSSPASPPFLATDGHDLIWMSFI
jgi:hypothetical protein